MMRIILMSLRAIDKIEARRSFTLSFPRSYSPEHYSGAEIQSREAAAGAVATYLVRLQRTNVEYSVPRRSHER